MACALINKPMVLPSGAERATSWVAITLLAPGLFTTTTGTPKAAESGGAIARPMTSEVPPGAKVTTIRMGLLGQGSALAATPGSSAASVNRQKDVIFFMISSGTYRA